MLPRSRLEASTALAAKVHGRRGSPIDPHGQGFMALATTNASPSTHRRSVCVDGAPAGEGSSGVAGPDYVPRPGRMEVAVGRNRGDTPDPYMPVQQTGRTDRAAVHRLRRGTVERHAVVQFATLHGRIDPPCAIGHRASGRSATGTGFATDWGRVDAASQSRWFTSRCGRTINCASNGELCVSPEERPRLRRPALQIALLPVPLRVEAQELLGVERGAVGAAEDRPTWLISSAAAAVVTFPSTEPAG